MRNVDAAFQAMLDTDMHTLAKCWRVLRSDNKLEGYTNHTRNLTIDDLTYQMILGLVDTSLRITEGFSVDSAELTAFLTSANEDDLQAGRYDHARVSLLLVNWQDTTMPPVELARGRVGVVQRAHTWFTAEQRGLSQILDTRVGEVMQPACNVALGSRRCGVVLEDIQTTGLAVNFTSSNNGLELVTPNSTSFLSLGYKPGNVVRVTGSSLNDGLHTIDLLNNYLITFTTATTIFDESSQTITLETEFGFTFSGIVDSVNASDPRRIFGDSTLLMPDGSAIPTHWFASGEVRFTSGKNIDVARNVRSSAGGLLTTLLPFPFDVQLGDAFTVVAGCDNSFESCQDKFGNVDNFQGFKDVPTAEDLLYSPQGVVI